MQLLTRHRRIGPALLVLDVLITRGDRRWISFGHPSSIGRCGIGVVMPASCSSVQPFHPVVDCAGRSSNRSGCGATLAWPAAMAKSCSVGIRVEVACVLGSAASSGLSSARRVCHVRLRRGVTDAEIAVGFGDASGSLSGDVDDRLALGINAEAVDADGEGMALVEGPDRVTFPLTHWDADTFTYIGSRSTGPAERSHVHDRTRRSGLVDLHRRL